MSKRHEFGQRVRQRREALGLGQKELAYALRVDQGKVSLLEQGARRIDAVEELPALAQVLQCSVDYLLGCQSSEGGAVERLVKDTHPHLELPPFELQRLTAILNAVVLTYIN